MNTVCSYKRIINMFIYCLINISSVIESEKVDEERAEFAIEEYRCDDANVTLFNFVKLFFQ